MLTFRDNLSVLSSRVKNPRRLTLKTVPRGCPETSVRNYHSLLCNGPEEHSFRLLRGSCLKSHILKKNLRFYPFVLLVRAVYNLRRSRSTDAIRPTAESVVL